MWIVEDKKIWRCNSSIMQHFLLNKRNRGMDKKQCSTIPKKVGLRISKKYGSTNLTAIAAKYLLWSASQQYPTRNRENCRFLERVRAKALVATLMFIDFSKKFDSRHRTKMELVLLAYGILEGTVIAIKILYKNRKAMVRLPDGDTDIIARVLQKYLLAPCILSSA